MIEDTLGRDTTARGVRGIKKTLAQEIAHYADTAYTESQVQAIERCVIVQNDKPLPENPIDNDFCPGELAECPSDDGGPRIIIEHWVCEFWVRTKCITIKGIDICWDYLVLDRCYKTGEEEG